MSELLSVPPFYLSDKIVKAMPRSQSCQVHMGFTEVYRRGTSVLPDKCLFLSRPQRHKPVLPAQQLARLQEMFQTNYSRHRLLEQAKGMPSSGVGTLGQLGVAQEGTLGTEQKSTSPMNESITKRQGRRRAPAQRKIFSYLYLSLAAI